MIFQDYFSRHPDRLKNLDQSDTFYAGADEYPVHPSQTGGLVDVTSLFSCLPSRGGKHYKTFPDPLLSYLKSGRNLAHPDDTYDTFQVPVERLRAQYVADKRTYEVTAGKTAPFFVHPETAFGFLRYILRDSDQLYGQPLTSTSILVSAPIRKLVVDSLEVLKTQNFRAWHFANNDISLKIRASMIRTEGRPDEVSTTVQVMKGSNLVSTVKIEINTVGDRAVMPTFNKIIEHLQGLV